MCKIKHINGLTLINDFLHKPGKFRSEFRWSLHNVFLFLVKWTDFFLKVIPMRPWNKISFALSGWYNFKTSVNFAQNENTFLNTLEFSELYYCRTSILKYDFQRQKFSLKKNLCHYLVWTLSARHFWAGPALFYL